MRTTKILFLFISLFALVFTSCEKDVNLSIVENVYTSDDYSLKVIISWDAVSDADGYNIYRADYDYSVYEPTELIYTKIGITSATSYEDWDVLSGTTYYYRVEAYSGSSTGALSDPILGITTTLTAAEAFDVLAEYTDGITYNAYSAAEVPTMINQIISNHAVPNTDLVFLIDNTASMVDDIYQVQQAISNIMAALPSGTRVGAAVYNDLNEDPYGWYDWEDLTTIYSIPSEFINTISVYGGGDWPESVYDGIVNTVSDMSWTSGSKRIMIVIGDAPPLEGDLTNYTLNDVIEECTSLGVTINLYPILIAGYKKSSQDFQ
ncbi:MAG: VWA domain-containing protein [Bacteroidales bacterium]|nr:VWA domain-containing protein [Bacteroidales bacterium]